MSERKMYNFPFVEDGQTYWRSRSVALAGFIFCKNKDGEWCVLADKRGPGCPDEIGKWCVVCGYLDFFEAGNEGVARETREETGVNVEPSSFEFDSVHFSENKDQNVTLRYWVALTGTTDDYPLSNAENEPGETTDIKWIKVTDVDKYEWAFGHEVMIPEMYNKHVEKPAQYLVSVIETTWEKRKLAWLQKVFIGSIPNNWDVECYGRIPLVTCNSIDKCNEYVSAHLKGFYEAKKQDGFKLSAFGGEELVENLFITNSHATKSLTFYKTDKNGHYTKVTRLEFDFTPVENYE